VAGREEHGGELLFCPSAREGRQTNAAIFSWILSLIPSSGIQRKIEDGGSIIAWRQHSLNSSPGDRIRPPTLLSSRRLTKF